MRLGLRSIRLSNLIEDTTTTTHGQHEQSVAAKTRVKSTSKAEHG